MARVKRRLRMVLPATAGFLLIGGVLAAVPSGASAQSAPRLAFASTHPTWATTANRLAQQPTGSVTATVYLAGQNPAGLAAYAMAASTPGNALYRHFLTPAQVMARYGPTTAQISAVKSWLTGDGMSVTSVKDEFGGYVRVHGTVAQASATFGTSFATFRGPGKKDYRAPESSATVPRGVSADVSDISGLDTAPHLMKPGDTLPPAPYNYWVAQPCSQYYGQLLALDQPKAFGKAQPWTNCGYTPKQIAGAYGVTNSGMTGKGQTVAVVDAYASPTMMIDANKYSAAVGEQPFKSGQYTEDLSSTWSQTAPDECDASGWYGEETLDVEAVHGQAPGANVVYVGAASCTDDDLLAALTLIVDNHLASIVTNSWGEPFDTTDTISTDDAVFQAGAAEGIGFFFSSGDDGYESPAEDAGSDQIQVDWPSTSPYVTSVGGTSLAIGKNNNYEFETPWGTLLDPLSSDGKSWQYTPPGLFPDFFDGAGGGGVSDQFDQPSYQRGVVPHKLSITLPNGVTATQPMRVTPDVSTLADASTGFLVGETVLQPDGTTYAFSLSRIGGTSVASPTFAGIEADAQQAAGHPLGFANPVIYKLYNTKAFHDVVQNPLGSGFLGELRNNYTDPDTKTGPLITWLRTLGVDGEGASALVATKGYDDATGVGSPDLYVQSFMHSGY